MRLVSGLPTRPAYILRLRRGARVCYVGRGSVGGIASFDCSRWMRSCRDCAMGLDSCCPSTPPSPPSPTPPSTARLLLETASVCAARTARLLCSRLLLALRRSAHRQPTRAPAAPDARIVAMRRDDEPRAVMRGYARLRAVTAMMSGYERLQRRRAVRGNSGRVLSEHLLRYVRYSVLA